MKKIHPVLVAVWLTAIAVWGLTVFSGSNSIVFNHKNFTESHYVNKLSKSALSGNSVVQARKKADAYWDCNPDVAADQHFGRHGPLGYLGAQTHFDRHGKQEGRVWPGKDFKCD